MCVCVCVCEDCAPSSYPRTFLSWVSAQREALLYQSFICDSYVRLFPHDFHVCVDSSQVFDAASFFSYASDGEEMCVVANESSIAAESDIFILDHAITVKWVPVCQTHLLCSVCVC